jgi:PAS domain S-box-containing protein
MEPKGRRNNTGKPNFPLTTIIDFLPDPTFVIDLEGKVIAWNKAIAKLCGIPAEDMLGKGDYAYAAPFCGERRPILIDFALRWDPDAANLYNYIETSEGCFTSGIETVLIRQKPFYLWAAASRLCDAEGNCIGAIETIRDITEIKRAEKALRESEQRLSAIFARAAVGLSEMSPEGRFIKVNDTYCQILGRTCEHLLTLSLPEVTHPDDLDRISIALKRVLENGELESLDKQYVRPDQTVVHANCSLTRIDNAQNLPQSILAVTVDMTDRRRASDRLEQRVAERTRLAESRAKMLQSLAVELIEAEERERRRIAHVLHEDLQQIIAAARYQLQEVQQNLPSPLPMLSSVEDLLEESIGKARLLSHELSPAVLVHSGMIEGLKWLVRHMGQQFGLQIELEVEANLPQVDSMPMKVFIFRAIQELLFNVVKHARAKSARVAFSFADSRLMITVRDPGVGFETGKVDLTDTRFGFGLISLRERARHMGGDLVIESAPGKGSRLTMTLPISLVASDTDAMPIDWTFNAQAERMDTLDSKDIRVLFVDDHQVLRKGLIGLITAHPNLQLAGEASNGREAVERALQLRPDVILMDISMPEMDGIEATRRIKSELPDVRVIGLSMHQDEMVVKAMLAAGAENFVAKTASSADLLKAIYGGA